MTKKAVIAMLAPALLVGFWLLSAGPGQAEESQPVVLELFTSQGCSSCPPADDLLSRIGRSTDLGGRIIPLAYHVDYWDRLGWPDPFSQAAWTARQNAYAASFRRNSLYTPQIVINGRDECVGSDHPQILAKIRSAGAAAPLGRVRLQRRGYDPAQRLLHITLTAEILREGKPRELRLMVAVFENGFTTKVSNGENGGKTLSNDYVVHTLEPALTLPAKAGQSVQKEITLSLQPGWDPQKTGVAAFLQDPQSLEIHGAALLDPT